MAYLQVRHNALVAGAAYLTQFLLQLQATARYHKKSPYTLLSPYLDRIAPYLVTRMKTHPTSLSETCAFMSTPVVSFITVTLAHTLPPLFANREREILDMVAKNVQQEAYGLFLDHASRILAHVFMLSKPGMTTAALTFIVELLSAAKTAHGDNDISAQSVVRGHTIEVIAEIVMKMGDDDSSSTLLVSLPEFSGCRGN